MDRDGERAPDPEFRPANPGDGSAAPLAWSWASDAQRATQPLPIQAGPVTAGTGSDLDAAWMAAVPDPSGVTGTAGAALEAAGPAVSGNRPWPPGSGDQSWLAGSGDQPPPARSGDQSRPPSTGDQRPPATQGARTGRGTRYFTLAPAAVLVVLLLAAPTVLLTAWAKRAHPGSADGRVISVSALAGGTVYLQAPPGLLVVTGGPGGQARLTGQLHWSGRAPAASVTAPQGGHVLRLSYRCAAASPCTGNLRLTVPGRARLVLVLPSGRMVLSGLAGPVSIAAENVSVQAAGLRSPAFTALIRSGQLTAGFAGPPRLVQVTLASAQATLRLPGGVGYAVSTQVSSGSVSVGVPRSAGSAYRVSARLDMAELRLLPA